MRIQKKSRTAIFFATAYTISWAAWVALFAQHLSPFTGLGRCLYIVAVLAPHAAAILITAMEGGGTAVTAFYRRIARPIALRWAMVAICVPPLIYLLRDAISVNWTHGAFFHHPPRTITALLFGQLIVVTGEEPGWRGFALPRLAARFGPIAGTLILGIAWTCWHLPLFIIPGTPQYGTGLLPFALLLIAWSVIVTFIMTRTRGSVISAMLFHASANICAFTMWEPAAQFFALAPWILAALIATWCIQSERNSRALTEGAH